MAKKVKKGKKKVKPVKKAKVAKGVKKKRKVVKRKAPPPAPVEAPAPAVLHYKDREVKILRPAQPTDSGYLEGQDQLLVHFVDDGHEVLAFRADLV